MNTLWILLALAADAAPHLVAQANPSAHVDGLWFSPDGTFLAAVHSDGSLRVWSVAGRGVVLDTTLDYAAGELVFDATNTKLTVAFEHPQSESAGEVIDLITGERSVTQSVEPGPVGESPPEIVYEGPNFRVAQMQVFEKGIVGGRGDAWVWCGSEKANRSSDLYGDWVVLRNGGCYAAAVDAEAKHFAIGDFSEVRLFDFNTGLELYMRNSPAMASPDELEWLDGGRLLRVGALGRRYLWDLDTLRMLDEYEMRAEPTWKYDTDRQVGFAGIVVGAHRYVRPDENHDALRLFLQADVANIEDPPELGRVKLKGGLVHSLVGDQSGERVAATITWEDDPPRGRDPGDSAVMLWGPKAKPRWIEGAEPGVVVWRGDGLYTGTSAGIVRQHDPGTGDVVKSWQAHTGPVRSLALLAGGDLLTGGADGRLIRWEGERQVQELAAMSSVAAVTLIAPHPNRPYVAAVLSDGRTGLWHLERDAHVYLWQRKRGWLISRDDGLFDGSRRGVDMLVSVDEMEVVGLEASAQVNNRPDRILADLGLSNSAFIAHLEGLHQRRVRKAGVGARSGSRPSATLTGSTAGREAEVHWRVSDRDGDLAAVLLSVDGVLVSEIPVTGADAEGTTAFTLPEGTHQLELSAVDAEGAESPRRALAMKGEPFASWSTSLVFYVGFGVSDYARSDISLKWAHQDALDIGQAIAHHADDDARVRTWTNSEVTPAALAEARTFLESASPDDVLVLFVAGHGLYDDDGTWYYLPHGGDPGNLAGTAIPFSAFEDVLTETAALQKLFLLDTCESGERDPEDGVAQLGSGDFRPRSLRGLGVVPKGGLKTPKFSATDRFIYNDLSRRSGAIVFSSSRGNEDSLELDSLGQGLFTHAILEGFGDQEADENGDTRIDKLELLQFVERRVEELSAGRQHPVIDRDNLQQPFYFPVYEPPQ